jgi:tetrahydromethanopterin S-methyltransferase subunit G
MILLRNVLITVMTLSSVLVCADDWRIQESKLNGISSKVSAKKAEMEQLIEEKAHTTDKESLHGIVVKMSATQKDMLEKETQLRELKNHLRFSYPEHGVEMDRKYTPIRREDLEKYEAEIGIDGKLNRVKQHVHEVYGKDSPAKLPLDVEAGESTGKTKPLVERPNRSILKPEPTPDRIKITE